MNLDTMSHYTLLFRKGCDYIPAVSTVNNLIDLVTKAALDILQHADSKAYHYAASFSLVKEIDRKRYSEAALLAIPFLNIYIARFREMEASDNTDEPPAPPSRGGSFRKPAETADGSVSAPVEQAAISQKTARELIRAVCEEEEGKRILREILEKKAEGNDCSLKDYLSRQPSKKKSRTAIHKKKSTAFKGAVKGAARKGKKLMKDTGGLVLRVYEARVIEAADQYLGTEEGRGYARSILDQPAE